MRVAFQIARYGGQACVLAAVVVLVTFLLIHIVPGDPALNILGTHATPDAVAALHKSMHLDRPLSSQFTSFVSGLVHGNLGNSILGQNQSVASIIGGAMPVTLAVIAVSIAFSLLVALPLGLWAALTRHRVIDGTIRAVAIAFLATPPFYLGLLLILFVAVRWEILPAGGWGSGWPANVRYVLMPSLALAGFLVPVLTRAVRQTARETMQEPFIEAAIVRGLSRPRLVFRHVLPNSLLPVITLVGYNVASLIGGAVVVEAVFNLPGIGTELVRAVGRRDFPVVQGIALVTGLGVVAINLFTDLLYAAIDPRLRRR